MDFYRVFFGGVIALIGVFLVGVSWHVAWPLVVLGVALFFVGVVIFFNEREDKIEQIKYDGGKK